MIVLFVWEFFDVIVVFIRELYGVIVVFVRVFYGSLYTLNHYCDINSLYQCNEPLTGSH